MPDEVFPQLVDAYYPALYRFALSLARNPADASDLTQQTFFLWATKGHTLRDFTKVKTWLFTTLHREFLGMRRRDWRQTPLEDLGPAEKDPPALEADGVNKLDAPQILAALQELEPIYRSPLTLFYLRELSYQEIAEVLEVPIGTVMSRISRAKAQLRAVLAQKTTHGRIFEFPPQERSHS
jgi:RNA polymerase sigma-70 factor (ECF subfamily)